MLPVWVDLRVKSWMSGFGCGVLLLLDVVRSSAGDLGTFPFRNGLALPRCAGLDLTLKFRVLCWVSLYRESPGTFIYLKRASKKGAEVFFFDLEHLF